MNFTPAQLEHPAIALLASEIDTLPGGVTVEVDESSHSCVSLNSQIYDECHKDVFIGYYPGAAKPFTVRRTLVVERDIEFAPPNHYALKSEFRQELAEAIKWLTSDRLDV